MVRRSSSWAKSVIGLVLRSAAEVMMFFLLFAAAVATIETSMAVLVVVSIGWHDVGNASVVVKCLRVDPAAAAVKLSINWRIPSVIHPICIPQV